MSDNEWLKLGGYTVTDTETGEVTSVELWQLITTDEGRPGAEYRLDLVHDLEELHREQYVYIPAEAMPELHWLLGKAVGDETADNLRTT